MNIHDMTPQEKSVILARLALDFKRPSEIGRCDVCYWSLVDDPADGCTIDSCSMRPPPRPRADEPPALYDPANMALAMKVIRWGIENSTQFKERVAANAYHILRLESGINDALDELIAICTSQNSVDMV